jgi:folate-binding protein YgfZ
LEFNAMTAIDDVYEMPHLAAILMDGTDAEKFLQSQLSSNVLELAPGAVQLSSWCAVNGRVIGLGWLFRTAAGFCWIVAADSIDALVLGLNKYKLRAKVRLTVADTGVIGAEANFSEAMPVERFASIHSVQLADGRRLGCGAEFNSKTAPENFLARWYQRDIELKIPWNAGGERFLPQMLGIERYAGLSLRKGCFPGQEVISRLHYKGVLKRSLRVLLFDQPVDAGTYLCADAGDEVAIIQAQGFNALAVVGNNLSRKFSIQIKGADAVCDTVSVD